LQLILKAHKTLNELLNEGKNICFDGSERFESQKVELLKAVQTIGYPSQILHNAQKDKTTLRDIETLMKVAQNQDHARFHESWLLLSTNDYQRLNSEELSGIITFISRIASSRKVTKNRIVQINIANVKYSDLELSGNTCFVGTNNFGKTSLQRAILFFYSANTRGLGISASQKPFEEHYFKYENSYLIYEIQTESKPFFVIFYYNKIFF
jgi:hypothetical protein